MIACLLLAAGASRRLGQAKQLLPVGGRPLLDWPLAALRQYGPAQLVLVLGYEAEAITRAVDLAGVDVMINARYAEGLSTSLQVGLACARPSVTAAIVVSGDQPFVTSDLFRLLEARYVQTRQPLIATDYGSYRGVPLLLDRIAWPLVAAISGDQGARALLREHPDLVATVPAPDARMAIDVDTMAQYDEACRVIASGLTAESQTILLGPAANTDL
jgi:molybdenum cofactor cytidylyltransferase